MSPKGQSVVKVTLGLMVVRANKVVMFVMGELGKRKHCGGGRVIRKCLFKSHKAFHVFITPLQMTNCLTLGAVKLPFQLCCWFSSPIGQFQL